MPLRTSLDPFTGSSTVDALGYDRGTQTLEVRFKSGPTVYQYNGVDSKTVDDLRNADSAGKFVRSNIAGVFDFERIDPEEPSRG